MGNSCNCKMDCFGKMNAEVRDKIFNAFYKLPSKDLQDSYLCGNIVMKKLERRRKRREQNNRPKSVYCEFMVKDGPTKYSVCKNALLSIHGIKKGRLNRIINHLKVNVSPPPDHRGQHTNRLNKISPEVVSQIHEHILSIPKYKSHYSRTDNINNHYLSPLLNIAKLHEMYLAKYEPDQNKLLQDGKQNDETFDPIIKYEFFRKYFTENFNISFGKPKSDSCQKCDKLTNKIEGANTEVEKQKFITEKKLHLAKAEIFYNDLKEKTAFSKKIITYR